jgi:hypothetical protein
LGWETVTSGNYFLEVDTRVANVAKALPRILLQAPHQQPSNEWRRSSRERLPIDIVPEHRREDLRHRLASKRQTPQ